MPSKRKPKLRESMLSDEVIAILGVGCGINRMPQAELEALWATYGRAVIEHHDRHGWGEPFCAMLAREEGWE